MRRKICRLICAVVMAAVFAVPIEAWGLSSSGKTSAHHTAPLVPAMLLVVSGMGISMLFDKHE